MQRLMLVYMHLQQQNFLLIGGAGLPPVFLCLKKIQKKHRAVTTSVFSDIIKQATPPSAINTWRGLSKPLESLSRLGAPMNILWQSVPSGNGCKNQHPQTMQGGAA